MVGTHYSTDMQMHVSEESRCKFTFKIEWYRAKGASILGKYLSS